MKLHEQYYNDIVYSFTELGESITVHERMLTENVTYYELRQFVAMLMKSVRNKETKSTLNDIMFGLGKLEIMQKPAPTIKKLKSVSPKIFQ